MYYVEWYNYQGKHLGTAKGRLAVYFRSKQAAYDAVRVYTLDHKIDGFEVKQWTSNS